MRNFLIFVALVVGAGWYASQRFNFSDAMAYAQKHPEKSWSPAVEYSVAMVYYQRADYQKSQEAFTQLLTDFPTGQYEARALLRLSEVAEQNRDWPTAKETLDHFLADFPDHPDRQLAERRKEMLYNK
jgi:outer membrane protein assembly factor BamD (BamD/ComL family)